MKRLKTVASILFPLIWVITYLVSACSSPARAQSAAPDIYHRDFGTTTCYYTMNSATGDVGALSCVK